MMDQIKDIFSSQKRERKRKRNCECRKKNYMRKNLMHQTLLQPAVLDF